MKGKLENKYELDNIEFQMFKDKVVIGCGTLCDRLGRNNQEGNKYSAILTVDTNNTYLIQVDNNTYESGEILEFIVTDILPTNEKLINKVVE